MDGQCRLSNQEAVKSSLLNYHVESCVAEPAGSLGLYAPRENSFSILITVSASTKSIELRALLDRLRLSRLRDHHRRVVRQSSRDDRTIENSDPVVHLHPLDPREITDANDERKNCSSTRTSCVVVRLTIYRLCVFSLGFVIISSFFGTVS